MTFKTLLVALEIGQEYLLYCNATVVDMLDTVLHLCTAIIKLLSIFSFCNCWQPLIPQISIWMLWQIIIQEILFVFIACLWSFYVSALYLLLVEVWIWDFYIVLLQELLTRHKSTVAEFLSTNYDWVSSGVTYV